MASRDSWKRAAKRWRRRARRLRRLADKYELSMHVILQDSESVVWRLQRLLKNRQDDLEDCDRD
jgi:hypothetical protein